MEVNLEIPEIKAFNEDMLILAIEDSAYAQEVPIQLGTLHIDRTLDMISEEEITQLSIKWKLIKTASLLTGKVAQVGDKLEKTFLQKVDRTVELTKAVEIPPFSTIQVHGVMKVKGHDKRVNLVAEPKNNEYNTSIVVVPSYANLRPGSSKINMSLRNPTSRNMTVKTKSIEAQVAAANVVPPMLTPKNPQESEKQKDKRMKFPDKEF